MWILCPRDHLLCVWPSVQDEMFVLTRTLRANSRFPPKTGFQGTGPVVPWEVTFELVLWNWDQRRVVKDFWSGTQRHIWAVQTHAEHLGGPDPPPGRPRQLVGVAAAQAWPPSPCCRTEKEEARSCPEELESRPSAGEPAREAPGKSWWWRIGRGRERWWGRGEDAAGTFFWATAGRRRHTPMGDDGGRRGGPGGGA